MKPRFVGVSLWSAAALAVVLTFVPVPAAAFHEATVHLEGGAWFPKLTVEARSSGFGIEGNLLTESDLGLDDPDVVIIGAVTFRIAQRHMIRIEGFGFSVDGGRDTGETFAFNGRTYPVGTPINTEADVVFAGADYGFDLVHTEPVALGLTLGVRFVSAEAKITAPLLNQEGKGDYQTALPAVGSWACSIRFRCRSSDHSR